MTTQREAELELQVAMLRDAVAENDAWHRAYDIFDGYMDSELQSVNHRALSTPFTTTALPAIIEAAEKNMRDRCAAVPDKVDTFWNGHIVDEIRALPTGQIKLEELL